MAYEATKRFVLDGEGTRNIAIDVAIGARPDNVEIGWVEFRNYQPMAGVGEVAARILSA